MGLLSRGSIRIGTLHDFRKQEHQRGISDPQEGRKIVYHDIDEWNEDDEVEGQPSIHKRAMSEVGMWATQGGAKFSGITFAKHFDDSDKFIHCTSIKLDKSVMLEFEKADSCVEIRNFDFFYDHITEKLNKNIPVKFLGVYVVQYRPREEIWNGVDFGISPSILKEDAFSGQHELRAVWQPLTDAPIEPQVMEIRQLSQYCRLIPPRTLR